MRCARAVARAARRRRLRGGCAAAGAAAAAASRRRRARLAERLGHRGGGSYVTDLEQAEFEVFEDGAKQKVTFFSRKQQPIALAILLDTSNSMEDKLETAQEAAVGFAAAHAPGRRRWR